MPRNANGGPIIFKTLFCGLDFILLRHTQCGLDQGLPYTDPHKEEQ